MTQERHRLRRTKIVATLGPATDSPGVLDRMVRAGMDVVRVNFSHGEAADHVRRVEAVRQAARNAGREVAVLADLQGPKIRTDRFAEGKVFLEEGERFVLDAGWPANGGNKDRVGITYKELPNDVVKGDNLLLDDGKIVLEVTEISGGEIICRVLVGGELSNNKGINRLGGGLSAAAITDKDRADIKVAAAIAADYVAVSFPRNAADINEARELLRAAGGHGAIVAKVERAESLAGIEDIIAATDVVMIARGDLGVEIGDAELPGVQKHLIQLSRSMNRVVITATQMMRSMVDSSIPTRAEVFDVANAVLDGTDAVMLSEETATGRYPVKVIEAMDRICRGAESQKVAVLSRHRVDSEFQHIDEAIAMASMYTANHLRVRAIAALTESGSTVQWMSRISSGIPIYALTKHEATRRKVSLFRGVYPVAFDSASQQHIEVNREVIDELVKRGTVQAGDLMIITKGDQMGMHGATNTMKIIRVGDY
ncbi:MAG: pyruvate kinase [Gammaproteobacteria bacterium]|nr:pyruvate kinase [Gammaproteobacteria bacterium]